MTNDSMSYLTQLISGILERLDYSIHHMSILHWGVLAFVSVFGGFLALKTKL